MPSSHHISEISAQLTAQNNDDDFQREKIKENKKKEELINIQILLTNFIRKFGNAAASKNISFKR